MAKLNKTEVGIILISVLLVVSLGLYVFYASYGSSTQSIMGVPASQLSSTCGGSVLSYQNVQIQSNNPNYPSGAWLATFVANCKGQQLITDSASTSEILGGNAGYRASNPVSTSLQFTKYDVTYPLYDSGRQANSYSLVGIPVNYYACDSVTGRFCGNHAYDGNVCQDINDGTESAYKQSCLNAGGYPAFCSGGGFSYFGGYKCLKPQSTTQRNLYKLSGYQTRWSLQFSLNGETTNLDSRVGQANANDYILQSTGSLVSNDAIPQGSDLVAVWNPASSSWGNLISTTANPVPDVNAYFIRRPDATEGDVNGELASYTTALTSWISNSYTDPFFQGYSSGFSGASLTLNKLNNIPTYPLLQITSKIAFVGISVPAPQPVFGNISPQSLNLQSGNYQTVTVPVTNRGDGGAITVSLSCNGVAVAQYPSSQSLSINSGETQNFQFTVGANGAGSGQCTAQASISGTSNAGTTSFSVTGTAKCSVNIPAGSSYVIQQNSDGTCALTCPSSARTSCLNAGQSWNDGNCVCAGSVPNVSPTPSVSATPSTSPTNTTSTSTNSCGLFQVQVTQSETKGGVNLIFWNLLGTQAIVQSCQTNWGLVLVTIAVILAIVVLGYYFLAMNPKTKLTRRKRR